MVNPFQIGGAVGSDAFCDRLLDREALREAIDRREPVLVSGDRHVGKTSLVQRVLADAAERHVLPVYVDLRWVDSRASFTRTVAEAFVRAAGGEGADMLDTARALYPSGAWRVERTGNGSRHLRSGEDPTEGRSAILDEVLRSPEMLAGRDRRRVAVAFDHVERLAELDDGELLGAFFRTVLGHAGVSYVFAVGRRRLGERLFQSGGAAGAVATRTHPVGSIGLDHWVPFVRSRFFRARKIIEKETVGRLIALTGGHPYGVQRIAHALWESTAPDEIATERRLEKALDLMLRKESAMYAVLWESLSLNQQRLLRALAPDTVTASPFSASFLRASRMGSASSVQRALQSLIDRDLVSRDPDRPVITDRFLALWLQRLD